MSSLTKLVLVSLCHPHIVWFSKGLWITPMTGLPFTATHTMVVTYSRRFSVYSCRVLGQSMLLSYELSITSSSFKKIEDLLG